MLLKYLLEKEFKQIRRNPFLPRLIAAYPIFAMMVFPWVVDLEVRDINLCVIDNDRSAYSRRLVAQASASRYFHLSELAATYDEAMESIQRNQSDVILEINPGFERELMRGDCPDVMISANSVNGTRGGFAGNYLSQIIADFSADIARESPGSLIEITPQYRYNPHLDYKNYVIPALMVILLTIICGFLPALNIVGEKEKGTIEQINVTPVKKYLFILSKLIPYWIIGVFILTVCIGLAALTYGLIPAGNLLVIYLFAVLFVITCSGLGLVVSNYSSTMQQAMFVMFFFTIVMLLMSGALTPVKSMPQWAQTITWFNPLRYFVEAMRAVYLKGSGFWDLRTQCFVLLGIAGFFSLWAVWSYKKK
ncbi:MAG: ABC transporter permease [Dysgonamonadaceae bacterium]|jgi:ABC-2 type transport system permease protein|nr:ABC transporter permease [Dysgonamonadaceae bacterium]